MTEQGNVRAAWRQAHREARLSRATGKRLFGIIIRAIGGKYEPFNPIALKFQSCLEAMNRPAESDRYRRTRNVLNRFGRLNAWRASHRSQHDSWREVQRVEQLRIRLLARRLIAPEPGGYVTGLLSEAPAKRWWDDYPQPVAPFSAADMAIYEGVQS